MKNLSIILVNWKSTDYLLKCLATVQSSVQGLDCEIIVVDNNSPDDSVDSVQEAFPAVLLLRSRENLGFARANNLGFARSSGKHLLFLNPDTEVIGQAISQMVAALETLPGAGIVGCKLLNTDLSVQTTCIQRFPTILERSLSTEWMRLRWPRLRYWGIWPLFEEQPEPVAVDAISGACLMIRRDVFEQVGGFSEDYFMYAEDVDLCFKVQQHGCKNYYVGCAQVVHHGGGSSRRTPVSQWAVVMQRKATLQFFEKTRGTLYARAYRLTMALIALFRLLLIAVSWPFRKLGHGSERLNCASRKWTAILKWAVGVESKAEKASAS
jgi:GT2 family glycosyltransferase